MLDVTRSKPGASAGRPKASWYSAVTNDWVCRSDVLFVGGGAVPAPAVLVEPEPPDELVLPAWVTGGSKLPTSGSAVGSPKRYATSAPSGVGLNPWASVLTVPRMRFGGSAVAGSLEIRKRN